VLNGNVQFDTTPQLPATMSVSFALPVTTFIVSDPVNVNSATVNYGDGSTSVCSLTGSTTVRTSACPSHFYSAVGFYSVIFNLTGSATTGSYLTPVVVTGPVSCGVLSAPSTTYFGQTTSFTFTPNPTLNPSYNISLGINFATAGIPNTITTLNSTTPATSPTTYLFTYPQGSNLYPVTETVNVTACVAPPNVIGNCLLCYTSTNFTVLVQIPNPNQVSAPIPSTITISLSQPLPTTFDTQNADKVYVIYPGQGMTNCPTQSNGGGSYTASCPAPNPALGVGTYTIQFKIFDTSNGKQVTYTSVVTVTL